MISTYIPDTRYQRLLLFNPISQPPYQAVLSYIDSLHHGGLLQCIFILMGNGGISLEQIDRLLAWQMHFHPLLKSPHRSTCGHSLSVLGTYPYRIDYVVVVSSGHRHRWRSCRHGKLPSSTWVSINVCSSYWFCKLCLAGR